MNGRYRYPPALRLLRPAEFKLVFDSAEFKVGQPRFLVLARPNGLEHPRLGLVIAKKKVRLAVQRNRIKRITRDSFRLQQHSLPPVDLLLVARADLGMLENADLHAVLLDTWKRLAKKYKRQASADTGATDA